MQGPASSLKDRLQLHSLSDAAGREKLQQQLAAGSLPDQLSVAAAHFRSGEYQVQSTALFFGRL